MIYNILSMKYNALDLFSGSGSATKFFRESEEWNVQGIDINPKKENDLEKNILDVKPEMFEKDINFIWASPPCKSFSVANIGNNWHKKNDQLRLPKSEKAVNGVQMVYHTLWLIQELDPDYWFLENPRGGLRKVIGEPQKEKRKKLDKELNVSEQKDSNYPGTVTYCQFGDTVMKPTDLWGEHPTDFKYLFCGNGMSCHTSASRGSKKGLQYKNKSDRAKIPEGLAKEVFEKVNKSI